MMSVEKDDADEKAAARREFAKARSNQDVGVTNDLAKMLVQSLILINGGAAAAILSFYGSSKIALTGFNAGSLLLYMLGVMCAINAGVCFMRMAQQWSEHWEQKFYGDESKAASRFNEAKKQRSWAYLWLSAGTSAFLAAGLMMGLPLYFLPSVAPLP